ncbi:transglutaminase-like domain-containing protein [Naasia lichenicola]|uniref:Transglutaminase family protein n=1 Tax=Naasia lichenicola TaxID=2565933 RepID=A0A4V3WTD6_9MICO|nr:transglutaminase family protein [Naasia lichenicola]THG31507.1 transglutaminase family protein [Naasia lichenicola]
MRRNVTSHIELYIADRAELVFAISAAKPMPGSTVTDSISFERRGTEFTPIVMEDLHGTVLHRFFAEAGPLTIDYAAEVIGHSEPVPVEPLDLVTYLRPSRYAESDSLLATAQAEFTGLKGRDLLLGVSSWVGAQLSYVPGSSLPTDGATQTLLDRQGVCRDYAHLCVALLRAMDVPARLVSVYAPGLQPMDFHAVAEAYVDGQWHVVDATALAPRQTLLRIATGRDAADTAFLSSHGGNVTLNSMWVTAVVDELPLDNMDQFVTLG